MRYHRFLLLLVVGCLISSARQFVLSQDSFFSADYKQELALAKQEGRPVFVEITEKGCPFCRLLEEQTLSDPGVRHVLESYAHVQLWWDQDPEQKALARSLLGRTAFPTLVFLNQRGEPAYTTMGYKKPEPFVAECVKASDLLGVAVPYDARASSQGQTPTGSLFSKPLSTANSKIATSSRNIVPRIWTAKSSSRDDGDLKMVAPSALSTASGRASQSENRATYSPMKEACADVGSGQFDRSIAILNKLLLSDAENAQARYVLAVAYVNTRRNVLAAQQYRLVIKLDPNSKVADMAREGLRKIGQ